MGSFESHLRAVWPLEWAWRPGPSLFYPVHLDDFGGEGWDIYFEETTFGYRVTLVHWRNSYDIKMTHPISRRSRCKLDIIGFAMQWLVSEIGYLPGYEEKP